MKKVLSVLGLIAILGITTPAMAAPMGPAAGGPGGPGGAPRMHAPMPGGGHRIQAGPPHVQYARPRTGVTIYGGYPRHSCWRGYRYGYWCGNRCDYRLGWYDDYCYSPCRPMSGIGVSIRF